MTAPNVLLITIDSLRHDYGSLLDAASAEAATFGQAVACAPSTPSSFPAILTSTYPLMYGGQLYLSDDRPFVARTLQEAGYETVGFHSNPHLGANRNYDAGFETFNDTAEGSDALATLKDGVEQRLDPDSTVYSLLRRLWHRFSIATDNSAYAKAGTITDNALGWLDRRSGEGPFFMWLHYMDVHYPFTPPNRFRREVGAGSFSDAKIAELNRKMQEEPEQLSEADVEDLLALYRGEIRYTDHHIGRLLDELARQGELDETATFVTADHGEAFGEHGRFGHHPYLYDELLRVPLFVRGPGIEPRKIDQQVSLLDLGPTIYDLVGVETPEAAQGESFEPLLRGGSTEERTALCTGRHGDMLACRTSAWKCFWRVADAAVELYDLTEDPEETVDVSDDHPDVVAGFREQMEAYLADAESSDVSLPEIDDSSEVQQRLRDLGYVD